MQTIRVKWLDESFRTRYNISSAAVCGEKGSENSDVVDDWNSRLAEIVMDTIQRTD